MKKFLLIAVMVLPITAFPQIEAGKMTAGATGVIGIKPSGTIILGAQLGKMLSDNLEGGMSFNFTKVSGVDPSFGFGADLYYHIPLSEKVVGFLGMVGDFPVKPSFSYNLDLNVGFDYFLGTSVALRIYNNLDVPKFDFGNLSDQIMIGTVAYF